MTSCTESLGKVFSSNLSIINCQLKILLYLCALKYISKLVNLLIYKLY